MYGLTDLQLQILRTYCRLFRVELRRYERRRRTKSFSLFGIPSFLIVNILCVVCTHAQNPLEDDNANARYGNTCTQGFLVRITVLVHYRLFIFNLKKSTAKNRFGNI